MKYKFNVTAFLNKEVEIEASIEEEAYNLMGEQLYDTEFSTRDITPDDYEWNIITE